MGVNSNRPSTLQVHADVRRIGEGRLPPDHEETAGLGYVTVYPVALRYQQIASCCRVATQLNGSER